MDLYATCDGLIDYNIINNNKIIYSHKFHQIKSSDNTSGPTLDLAKLSDCSELPPG